nr:MAG TPA: hypothetical protein [Caudoviricetes sp.]
MGNLIKGSELGAYKTIAMSVGVASKENRNGVKSRFLVLVVRDEDSAAAKSKRIIFWDEDVPGLIDKIKPFTAPNPNPITKGFDVDMNAMNAADNAADFADYLRFPGMIEEQYELAKGPCYANNADGERILDAAGNPVVRSTISVLTQVKFIMPDGSMKYFSGMDPYSTGARMESRFWREAVNATSAQSDGVVGAPDIPENPAPQAAPQSPF